ncbi:hypothetical protein ABPG75_005016 [Micractinium tetrahymenae]
MASSLPRSSLSPAGTRSGRTGSGGISPAAARPPPPLRPSLARPLAMLPPLPRARMTGVVAAGLGSYVRRHAAQLSVLGSGALSLGLLVHQSGLEALRNTAAAEVRSQAVPVHAPPDWPPEAWLLLLAASDILKVAACAGLCLATARQAEALLDRRRQRTEDVARALAQRQATLQRFSSDVLDRLLAAGVEDELGTVAAFREWYLAQLAASDALLRRLQGGGGAGQGAPDPAAQLAATLERLGLTAAELALLASGSLVSGGGAEGEEMGRLLEGGKVQGPSVPLRPRRIHGARKKRDPVQKERKLLERLVRQRTRADHHPAFQAYVAEMEAALERSLQASATPPSQETEGRSRAGGDGAGGGGEGDDQAGDAAAQRSSGSGSRSGCSTGDMLAAFDEGDCLESADDPDLASEERCGGGGGAGGKEE